MKERRKNRPFEEKFNMGLGLYWHHEFAPIFFERFPKWRTEAIIWEEIREFCKEGGWSNVGQKFEPTDEDIQQMYFMLDFAKATDLTALYWSEIKQMFYERGEVEKRQHDDLAQAHYEDTKRKQ